VTGRSDPARLAATTIAEALRSSGFVALFAGGCVRDRLLGRTPDDYDIATDATPDDVKRVFPHAHGVGESFGVMLVRQAKQVVEVATFRADGDYRDGRRPADVRFASAEEDARRRDFTVNGLFEEPATGRILDYVGGLADLDAKVLRAIGDPDARFGEDHLRLLRTARFAARLGFSVDPATADAARRHAPKLAAIAKERIGGELRKMLEHPSRPTAVELLHELRLDGPALAEAALGPIDVAHLRVLRGDVPMAAALAAWGLDRTGVVDRATIDRWRDALVLSNKEEADLEAIESARVDAAGWDGWTTAARKRWAARAAAPVATELLAVRRPDLAARIRGWLSSTDPASIAPKPFVRGDHLIRLGLVPGPRFKGILDRVYDAQLEGVVLDEAAALGFARDLLEGDPV
jgi:poly(A) polymerase